MQETRYDTEDLICALATPWVSSALAVIRMTGRGCVDAFAPFFSRPAVITGSPGGRIHHGWVVTPEGDRLDEVMASVFRAPHSYTGQDSVEISCHGSLPGLQRILGVLTRQVFRPAGPGEFTLRAFLNGKVDLTRAEAVQEIVSAKTQQAQTLALHRLGGGVERRIEELKQSLLKVVALVNIQLDYAEDDVEDQTFPLDQVRSVRERIAALAATYRTGRLYQEGVKAALAGRTNAGKSTLFNLFLKEDRSIVSEEHGTTRDWLESWITVAGLPVRLFDTAGLREADNLVEREGIRRSRQILDTADLIFYLVDRTRGLDADDREFLGQYGTDPRLVKVWTKADAPGAEAPDGTWIVVSAHSGAGFDRLEEVLQALVFQGKTLSPGQPVIDSLRQKQLLDRAAGALDQVILGAENSFPLDMIALDLKDAMDALGEITGEVTQADVLETMFSGFCVGK